ncbi:hypothetical protein [Vibrio phage vB_VpaS_CHI]|nr:hypothetical protein [Vibrio phage vB_VpaS_ALK]USL90120.1 hypothetical protein [Vibrio phage vB_VpaS_CHI]
MSNDLMGVILQPTIWVQTKKAPPKPTPHPVEMYRPFVGGTRTRPTINISSRNNDGNLFGQFWDTQFTDSIFLTPNRIDLGVSADTVKQSFELWHTFSTDLVINDIVQTGTRGITLTREGGGTKDTIYPFGLAKYTVNVSLQTDTNINAAYTWKTTPTWGDFSFVITGSRVVPWPYIPEGSFTEAREWLTDVIRTRKKEQRLSLRRGPRKTLTHSYVLSDSDLSNMWSHDKVWVNQTYAVPDWTKFMRIGPVSSGTTELAIPAIDLGLVASGFAFIYENNNKFEVRPVKAVQPNKVVFVDGVTGNYNDATIVVVELQKHQNPISIVRTAMGVSVAEATWEKLDDTLNASNPFPDYIGRPVVTDHILMGGTRNNERFGFTMDRIDSQTGLYTDFQEYDWETRTQGQFRWSCNDRAEFDRVRNFLDFCRGKQGEFFVPTWNPDFTIVRDINPIDQGVRVERSSVSLFFSEFHIMVEYVDGTRDYVKVTSAERDVEHDVLKTTPILGAKPMGQITRICRMNLMRFNTDRFEFQHRGTGVIDISAPIIAVPEI